MPVLYLGALISVDILKAVYFLNFLGVLLRECLGLKSGDNGRTTLIYQPGDIIFFNWDGDSLIDHVGIVEKVENGKIYTIEGNSNDSCVQNSYPLGYSKIYGFGIPLY